MKRNMKAVRAEARKTVNRGYRRHGWVTGKGQNNCLHRHAKAMARCMVEDFVFNPDLEVQSKIVVLANINGKDYPTEVEGYTFLQTVDGQGPKPYRAWWYCQLVSEVGSVLDVSNAILHDMPHLVWHKVLDARTNKLYAKATTVDGIEIVVDDDAITLTHPEYGEEKFYYKNCWAEFRPTLLLKHLGFRV